MTHVPAHPGEPLLAPTIAAAVNALRARGMRVSSARRLVLEVLFAAGRPVTADEVAAGLGGRVPPSDIGSVYRNLELLEAVGLITHVHVGHGPGRYALARDGEREYVACEACGSVQSVAPRTLDPVRAAALAACGHVPRFSHFPLVGLCAACAASHASPGSP